MKISIWNLAHVITSRTSPTVQWWMAQMTCFHPRTVLLGVRTMGDVMGENVPQKLQPWSLSTIMLLWHSFLIIIIITLGSNRPRGGFPPNRGNNNTFVTFLLYCFFSRSCPQVGYDCYAEWLKWRVSAQGRSFWGSGRWVTSWGKMLPQNSPNRGVNRQFQAKMPKSLHRNISGTINPTN